MPKCRINLYDICHTLELGIITGQATKEDEKCRTAEFRCFHYSKTSQNRTLLFQKVVRFSKISVYTKCRIAPANGTKFGLGGGFSDVSDRSSKPSKF